jgi:hypothetical protein
MDSANVLLVGKQKRRAKSNILSSGGSNGKWFVTSINTGRDGGDKTVGIIYDKTSPALSERHVEEMVVVKLRQSLSIFGMF